MKIKLCLLGCPLVLSAEAHAQGLPDSQSSAPRAPVAVSYLCSNLRYDSESMRRCRKTADHGDANAQVNLGWIYQNRCGLPQDYSEAMSLYRKAADKNSPQA